MTDQDDRKITYVQFFGGTKPIHEQIELLSEWYTTTGLTEICESSTNIAGIVDKWNDPGSCDLSSYDYYDIRIEKAVKPEHEGPAWVMWAENDEHSQSIYLEALDRRITIKSLFEDRGIQSAFICETESVASELKARMSSI